MSCQFPESIKCLHKSQEPGKFALGTRPLNYMKSSYKKGALNPLYYIGYKTQLRNLPRMICFVIFGRAIRSACTNIVVSHSRYIPNA